LGTRRIAELLSVVAFVLSCVGCVDAAARAKDREAGEEFQRRKDALLAVGLWVGAANPDRFVVEFGDYECPACRFSSAVLDSIAHGPDAVAVLFVSLPLPSHSAAYPAALASLCADEQQRGLQMHLLLMSEWSWQASHDWSDLARRADVPDTLGFLECLKASRTIARLERGVDLAHAMKVSATPTLIGPSGLHVGVPTRGDVSGVQNGR
jgi:protein-disulfide isomerase